MPDYWSCSFGGGLGKGHKNVLMNQRGTQERKFGNHWSNLTPNLHVLGLWEETGLPVENLHTL